MIREQVVQRFLRATQQGICPCCFRGVDLTSGKLISKHWYKRPGWAEVAVDCYGVGYPPFEVSSEGTKDLVPILRKRISWYEDVLRDLKAGRVKELWVHGWKQKLTKVISEDPDWEAALTDRTDKTELRIASLVKDIQLLSRLIAAWEPQALGAEFKTPMRFRL
jgi:hypothetical protein